MGKLASFVIERAGSLVSKKLGMAAAGSVVAVGAGETGYAVLIQVAYIVTQALGEGWKYYVDRRWPATATE